MSEVIENRVVELGFDNRNFEQNARTSIQTLGKLDEALQFKGVASGFRSIQNGLRYLDFSPITNGLTSVRDAFTNIGAAIKVNFFDMLGNEAIMLGRTIVSNTIGQIKSGGFSRALNIEQAQFKVKGLKGDWAKIYEDMDYAVSGTAYGIDEAANAAAQFMASGVQTGENMKAALRGISGIAAMASADYSSIADIFTAAAGKGRVQAMELQRISLHGINATAELGKQLGKTEEEIHDMASKGEIDFNTFAKAMDNAFGEHAKQANETYTGSLSNVKAALSRIGEIWYEPWIHGLIPIFNELRLAIDAVKNALKFSLDDDKNSVAAQLAKTMEAASSLATEFIKSLIPALTNVQNRMQPLFDKLKAAEEKILAVRDAIKAFNLYNESKDKDKTKENTKDTKENNKAIKENANALKTASSVSKSVLVNLSNFKDTFKKANETSISVLASLRGTTLALNSDTGMAIAEIIDNYDALHDSQEQAIKGSVNLFSEWNKQYSTSFAQLKRNLKSNVKGLETLMKDMQKIEGYGVDKEFVQYLKSMGTGGADIIHALAGASKKELEEYISTWNSSNKMMDTITDQWVEGSKKASEQAIQELTGVPEATLDDARKMYENMYEEIGTGASSSYSSGFSSIFNTIKSEYDKLNKSSDSSLFDSATTSMTNLATAKEENADANEDLLNTEKKVAQFMKDHDKEIKKISETYKTIGSIFSNLRDLFSKLGDVFEIVKKAYDKVFEHYDANILGTIAENISKMTKNFEISGDRAEYLERIFKGVFSVIQLGLTMLKDAIDFIDPFIQSMVKGNPVISEWIANIADFLTNINKGRQLMGEYPPLLQSIFDMGEMVVRTIRLIWEKLIKVLGIAKEAFQEVWEEFRPENSRFPDLITSITDLIRGFTIAGKNSEHFKNIFKGLFSVFHVAFVLFKEFKEFTKSIFSSIFGAVPKGESVILKVLGKFGDWIHQLSVDIKAVAETGGLFDVIVLIFTRIKDGIKSIFSGDGKRDSDGFNAFFDNMKEHIKNGVEKAVDWLKENKPIEWILSLFEGIDLTGIFGKITGAIGDFFKWIVDALKDEDSLLSRFISTVARILGELADIIEMQIPNIGLILDDLFGFLHRMFEENPELAQKTGEFIMNLMDSLITVMQVASETLVAIKDPLKEVSTAVCDILKSLGDVIHNWVNWSGENPEKAFGMVAFILIIWIINKVMTFIKTTNWVTFTFALKRIWTSISVFFSNLSGLAYRASQLMWAKELSTIATAILKVAVALALIGAVVGYRSENYNGLNAGLAILVVCLIGIIGFLKLSAPMKRFMTAGVDKMFLLGMAMNTLASAVLLLAAGFAVILTAISGAKWWETVLAIATFAVVVGAFITLFNEIFLVAGTASGSASQMLIKFGAISLVLVAFSASMLIMVSAISMLMFAIKSLYYATGKDTGDTIAIFVVTAAVIGALMYAVIAMVGALTVIEGIQVGAFVSMIAIMLLLTGVMGAMSLMMTALAASKASTDAWISMAVVFVAAILMLKLVISVLMEIVVFCDTMPITNIGNFAITMVVIAALMVLLTSIMTKLTLMTISLKLVTPDELLKLVGIAAVAVVLFAAAIGAVIAICQLENSKLISTRNMDMIAIALLAFAVLVYAMREMTKIVVDLQDVTADSWVLGDIFFDTIILFGAAIAAVAALTVLSKQNMLGSKLTIILGLAAVAMVFRTMISVMQDIANVVLAFKHAGITATDINMVWNVFDKLITTFEWMVVLVTITGALVGLSGPGTIALGILAVSGALLIVAISIKVLCSSMKDLGELILEYAAIWPEIRENVSTMLDDLTWVIPKAIEVICEGIILGVPAILACLYVIFVAVNAFLALIMPTQAAMFLLSINAMLDILLLNADVIIAKIFIFIDILLFELDAQAEIIGYEVTMIILKALWGAMKAIGKFLLYWGYEDGDSFYEAFKGGFLDRLSSMELYDAIVDMVAGVKELISNGELFEMELPWREDENGNYSINWYKMAEVAFPIGGHMYSFMNKMREARQAGRKALTEGDVGGTAKAAKDQAETDYKTYTEEYEKEWENQEKKEGKTKGGTNFSEMSEAAKQMAQNSMGNDELRQKLQEQNPDIDFDAMDQINAQVDSLKNSVGDAGTLGGQDFLTNLSTQLVDGFSGTDGIIDTVKNLFGGEEMVGTLTESAETGIGAWCETATNKLKGTFSSGLGNIDIDPTNLLNTETISKLTGGISFNSEDIFNNEELKNQMGDLNDIPGLDIQALGVEGLTNTAWSEELMNNPSAYNFGDFNMNVDGVDEQTQQLLEKLDLLNERVDILNSAVGASIILPQNAYIDITSSINGKLLGHELYPILNTIEGGRIEAMEQGLADPMVGKTIPSYIYGRTVRKR